MKTITSIFLAVVIFFIGLFSPGIPETKSPDELLELLDICKQAEIGQELYVIDSAVFKTVDERHMAVSLQGVVAKKQPQIFIITNDISHRYLEAIADSGIKLIYNDGNGNPWTLETLLLKFKSYIGENGYVLYRSSEKAEGLNVSTNLAALYGWLPVPESLEKLAKKAGLELKKDYSRDEYGVDFQRTFFEEYKEQFDCRAVVSLKYETTGLRDLAIQQGFYMFYIDDDEDADEFRGELIEYVGDNVPVLGWAKYEVQYVTQASKCGNMVIPTDHSHNNSFLASFECDIPLQKHTAEQKSADSSKHYCALVFSDGDNVQWIQNGYSEYFQKLQLEKQFPVTWSFSPLLQEFSPLTFNTVYSAATQEDYFIAGVSGAGYCHPTEYPLESLGEFTDMTAAAMLKSDLHYVSILDNTPDGRIDDAVLMHRLEYYARYDNIKGGVLSLDPSRYAGGEGRVYFVNDKPFLSNRFSLWHPDGEGTVITKEWLNEQAELVNSYAADINSVNGYSVINVHPWTISVDDLAYFVSQLDDHIQLVTLDELLTTMSHNVPHEFAEPGEN